jgi:predicted dehydrogenase
VNWGILATGSIAATFVEHLQMHGHTVVAVGSRTLESAKRFAERFNLSHAHGSYAALAANPVVDAIYVATPHSAHAESAKLALSHGKHVLVEKPFTINAREAAEVIDLAETRGLVVMEAMWARFLPHMARVREIVASGQLGRIRSLLVDHTQDISDDPAHRLNAIELGGGALLDLGIYPVSFTWDLLGPPADVAAKAVFKDTGADAQVSTIFRYDSGALAVTLSGSDTAGRNIATVLARPAASRSTASGIGQRRSASMTRAETSPRPTSPRSPAAASNMRRPSSNGGFARG